MDGPFLFASQLPHFHHVFLFQDRLHDDEPVGSGDHDGSLTPGFRHRGFHEINLKAITQKLHRIIDSVSDDELQTIHRVVLDIVR